MPVSPALPRVSECPPELSAFGRRVRKARTARRLSQARLARSIGLARGFVCNIENGRAQPNLLAVHAIARGLQVPPSWLFEQGTPVPEAERWP